MKKELPLSKGDLVRALWPAADGSGQRPIARAERGAERKVSPVVRWNRLIDIMDR